MTKKMSAAVIAVSLVALMAAFATSAQAVPTQTSACSGCHSKSTAVKISAVQTANTGGKATYKVTVSGPNPIFGWAVLSGSTNLAHATASSGTFTVADGKTYTVWAVNKTSANMPSSNSLSISPVAPPAPPTPTPTSTPVPTATPVPTTTPAATNTCVMRIMFSKPRLVTVTLRNTVTGRYYHGVLGSNNRFTFRKVPNGKYLLFSKYPHGKVHLVGRYAITRGRATKMAPPRSRNED